jgi:long-chain acyl-CoA synthetase
VKDSIVARFLETAERYPDHPALSWREGEERKTISYRDLARRVRQLAAGLAHLGLREGDRVLLLADNSPRWIMSDLALQYLGCVDVPRGSDTLPEELDHIVGHSEARVAILGTPDLVEHLGRHRESLAWVGLLEGTGEDALTFEDILAAGDGLDPGEPVPGLESLATIVYTSGTTGVPKGVPLTHGNVVHNVRTIPPLCGVGEHDRFLSILPAWHVYERTVEYVVLSQGAEMVYTSRRRLKEDLISEAPSFLVAVPRVFEAIYEGVNRAFRASSPFKRGLVGLCLGRSHALARVRNWWRTRRLVQPDAPIHRNALAALKAFFAAIPNVPLHALGKLLVYRKILRATGGRLRAAVSGGGALPRHVEEFFGTVGLDIRIGYGLTETSPVLTLQRENEVIRGTIGSPLPETEVQVRSIEDGRVLPEGEEGVLWFRGPQVFSGYYRDPERSAAVLDEDGFFDTGDLGRLTPWGDIVFTGRAKETIVLRSGENVEPEPIEMALLASPLIHQVILVGQDRKHLGALVVPNLEVLQQKLGKEPELDPGGPSETIVRSEVGRLLHHRKGFRPFERVHSLRLIGQEFQVEDGTLTPTLKMRRDRILARHQEDVEALFAEG